MRNILQYAYNLQIKLHQRIRTILDVIGIHCLEVVSIVGKIRMGFQCYVVSIKQQFRSCSVECAQRAFCQGSHRNGYNQSNRKDIKPRMVLPMHYKTDANASWPIAPLDDCLAALGAQDAPRMPLLRVTKEDLSEQPRIAILTDRA